SPIGCDPSGNARYAAARMRARAADQKAGERRLRAAKARRRAMNARTQRAEVDMSNAAIGDIKALFPFPRGFDEAAYLRVQAIVKFPEMLDDRGHGLVLERRRPALPRIHSHARQVDIGERSAWRRLRRIG